MLVAVDTPVGLAWGSSLPGALLPLEWATPRAITTARSVPVEWGETFRGSAAPLEWGAADRTAAARLSLETSVLTQPAEFAAPAEIAGRQTATADAAIPAEWGGQTGCRAPIPATARLDAAVAVEAPAEAIGSAVIASDRLLPFVVLAAARAAIAAPLPAELCAWLSPALLPQVEALQRPDFKVAALLFELLGGGRSSAAAVAESVAGLGGRSTTGPEFLAAMLLDPRFDGEFAALPGIVAALRGEMLAALRREAPVPTGNRARSGSAVAVKALLRIEWRGRKSRIRRLLASPGRRRVLGSAGPDSGR